MPLENSLGIDIGKDSIVDTELMLDPKRQYFIYRLGEASMTSNLGLDPWLRKNTILTILPHRKATYETGNLERQFP